MTGLLEIDKVSKRFGGYLALQDVSCEVAAGAIHALIGPNGAGKTTLFNIVSGVQRPTSGALRFSGETYTRRRPDSVCAMGVARNFQQVRLFHALSVIENVMIGAHAQIGGGRLRSLVQPLRLREAEQRAETHAVEMLDFVGLRQRRDVQPGDLTLVEQRRLEIARALASKPRLLLLDEPAAGMNPAEVAELTQLIRRIRQTGITILLVEHHMRLVMAVAERITVLSAGRIIAEGSPGEIQRNELVISAYLGNAG